MKKGLALLTTLGLAITGCTTNVFAADVVIKLADVQAENDVETQFEYKFAELVNEPFLQLSQAVLRAFSEEL